MVEPTDLEVTFLSMGKPSLNLTRLGPLFPHRLESCLFGFELRGTQTRRLYDVSLETTGAPENEERDE